MQLQREAFRDFSGGYNLRDAPLDLAPNDLLLLENMYPLAGGALIGRGGQTDYNATAIPTGAIRSLYRFYPQAGGGIMLATNGNEVYTGNDVNGTLTQIATGFANESRFSFASWSAKNKVYWINDVEALRSYDGTTVAVVGGSPPIGIQVEFHNDRLWILQDDFLFFSDLNVDNVWPATSALNISDTKGSTGSFVKSANGVLIAGKNTGLWRFEGSPLLGGELRKYSNIGCSAPWTARVMTAVVEGQIVPTAVIFLGADGVYMTDGYSVTPISAKLTGPNTIFTGNFAGAVGEYYPKKQQYYLSFNPAGGANNTLWVASKLDRPDGAAISWSKYTGHDIDSFAVWDGGSDIGQLYAGLSNQGRIRRLDVGQQDQGADYKCQFTTRYLDFGDSGVDKSVRWIKGIYNGQRPIAYTLNYFDRMQHTGMFDTPELSSSYWDVAFWDVGYWAGSGSINSRTSTVFSGQGRIVSLNIQNTGDGPNFRVDELYLEARVKDRRVFDVFSLYQEGA